MAFLDRLVSDLVKSSTGVNARGFVRMMGGKNILLLGGAALAGALAADKMGRSTTAPAPPPSAAPPPPPPRVPTVGETAPPPPPPVPSTLGARPAAADPLGELPSELAYGIVRTMVAAALADGQITAEERELIHKHLSGSDLSEEHIGQIHKDLVIPPSAAELARLVSSAEDRELLYRFGAVVILANREVRDLERQWLVGLARALEISPERSQELEKDIFVDEQALHGDGG